MDLDLDLEAAVETDQSSAEKIPATCEDNSVMEPYVGMEFESEDAAKQFYGEYARREGFIMRLDRCHRSEVGNRIVSRRLSCNKQGFHVRSGNKPVQKPRVSIREGCEAMIWVKANKCGKWVVTKFVKEHNHPLNTCGCPSHKSTDSKDRKIQQLSKELKHQGQLCQQYRGLLLTLLETVEDQTVFLSRKIESVANSVKQLESEEQKPLDTH